ncbi:nuclear transport factor 2 family protein [Sulfitobacter sp. G21635-S1]|uniref:nuclear transport factor 2 family protein n=1 Tax=Sulfitobacter sp. G21635-S1 TaxID=3014043 RepID=UPI003FCCEEE7
MQELHAIEHSLWATVSRFDPDLMEQVFADDFAEFGRSGRRYTRTEMLFSPDQATPIDATLHQMMSRALSDDISIVTYVSEVRYDGSTEWANRSSIWDSSSGGWKLRFHQGTPCAPLTPK